ncbi:MAG: hypothetical protein KAR54_00475 [Candidatus Pacebacteria bacterium]|nr:hypothetical protein [Candidatus Paceibacterota bacterium]
MKKQIVSLCLSLFIMMFLVVTQGYAQQTNRMIYQDSSVNISVEIDTKVCLDKASIKTSGEKRWTPSAVTTDNVSFYISFLKNETTGIVTILYKITFPSSSGSMLILPLVFLDTKTKEERSKLISELLDFAKTRLTKKEFVWFKTNINGIPSIRNRLDVGWVYFGNSSDNILNKTCLGDGE